MVVCAGGLDPIDAAAAASDMNRWCSVDGRKYSAVAVSAPLTGSRLRLAGVASRGRVLAPGDQKVGEPQEDQRDDAAYQVGAGRCGQCR